MQFILFLNNIQNMFEIFKKSAKEYAIIFIMAVCVLMIYQILFESNKQTENMINIDYKPAKWNRNKCEYLMNTTLENELSSNDIEKSELWNLYFPCAYDEIEKEVNQMPIVDGGKYFILENADVMVAKEWLWKFVVIYYGFEKAKTLLPTSYVLYENIDKQRFEREYDPKKLYIMKKNIQRQEGLKITKSKDEILDGFSHDYVLVQELLQDPYLIAGRKTNMRFYVLVVCKGDNTDVYVHNEGFMYYTKVPFVKNSLDDAPNITTGYIDRQVYIDNPLTHGDLRIYLDDPKRNGLLQVESEIRKQGLKISDVYFSRIYNLIRDVFMAFVGRMSQGANGKKKFNSSNITFQLFGVDVGVNDNLSPMIMEINKGPDLGAKDERDSKLKHGVVRDMLQIVGVARNASKNGFIKVLDIDDGKISETRSQHPFS